MAGVLDHQAISKKLKPFLSYQLNFGHSSGAPSDQIFLNTPEVPKMDFCMPSEACLVNLELP